MNDKRITDLENEILDLNKRIEAIKTEETALITLRDRINNYLVLEDKKKKKSKYALISFIFELLVLIVISASVSPSLISIILLCLNSVTAVFIADSIGTINKMEKEYPEFENLSSKEILNKYSDCLDRGIILDSRLKPIDEERNICLEEYSKLISDKKCVSSSSEDYPIYEDDVNKKEEEVFKKLVKKL